ncbi:hypothetical protein BDZ89DRAFT_1127027 [Hymenopellis radicata]|nr:hypothetical protein BDZ89DRAFT_1127027 [Hymenopellis radicata]
MKKLTAVVNVVSVITKADTLTIEKRDAFKIEVGFVFICLYPFDTDEDDEEEIQLNESIRDIISFAVVGSPRDHRAQIRKNRWDVVNVGDASLSTCATS